MCNVNFVFKEISLISLTVAQLPYFIMCSALFLMTLQCLPLVHDMSLSSHKFAILFRFLATYSFASSFCSTLLLVVTLCDIFSHTIRKSLAALTHSSAVVMGPE